MASSLLCITLSHHGRDDEEVTIDVLPCEEASSRSHPLVTQNDGDDDAGGWTDGWSPSQSISDRAQLPLHALLLDIDSFADDNECVAPCLTEVCPGLFIGSFRRLCQAVEVPGAASFDACLCVAKELPDAMPAALSHYDFLKLPLADSPTQDLSDAIAAAITFIDRYRCDGRRVVVCCRAGQSRSVAIVMAYVMHLEATAGNVPRRTACKVLEDLQMVYPSADPNPYFMMQLDQLHRVPALSS